MSNAGLLEQHRPGESALIAIAVSARNRCKAPTRPAPADCDIKRPLRIESRFAAETRPNVCHIPARARKVRLPRKVATCKAARFPAARRQESIRDRARRTQTEAHG